MYIADQWLDYAVLDSGDGEKLERWGEHRLIRPDPQVIWPRQSGGAWDGADARYNRERTGGGGWVFHQKLPENWTLRYGNLQFIVRPTGFKHTGLFPEQAVNWDYMAQSVRRANRPIRVLNLFAYTGAATCALSAAGAHVTHVDAAKGMVKWAQENRDLNKIPPERTRYIIDDALKFVAREARRGSLYEAVVMDPPSYGRGPGGEIWKIENEIYGLIEQTARVLSDRPLFFLINSYTTGLQPVVLDNMLTYALSGRFGGHSEAAEVALPIASGGLLPCGATGRWEAP